MFPIQTFLEKNLLKTYHSDAKNTMFYIACLQLLQPYKIIALTRNFISTSELSIRVPDTMHLGIEGRSELPN